MTNLYINKVSSKTNIQNNSLTLHHPIRFNSLVESVSSKLYSSDLLVRQRINVGMGRRQIQAWR